MHPICQSGQPPSSLCWYPDGYPISYLPLPVADPMRPWGSQNCSTCKNFCAGHYSTKYVDTNDPAALKCLKPPSVVLKQMFSELGGNPVTDEFVEDAARSVLLSVEDIKIWIDHLTTVVENRKRGAVKAAETRRRKRQAQQREHAARQSDLVQEREGRQPTQQPPDCVQREEYYCGTCGKD